MPRLDRTRQTRLNPIPGQPPSLIRVPKGCVFNPRCEFTDRVSDGRCFTEHPELLDTSANHQVRCHIRVEQRRDIFKNEIVPTL